MDIFLTATEARQRFLELLAEVKEGERIIITHRGKPAAAVIDFERLQLLTELVRLWQDPQSLSHIRAAHEDLRAGRVYRLKSLPTVKRLVDLARNSRKANQSDPNRRCGRHFSWDTS
jgi:prevent-host-death family protein